MPTTLGTGSADAANPAQTVLEVDDVVVNFDTEGGRITAVDGVSLQLATGETLGLVGESGCGKSTLARAIMQLVSMTRGTVRLEGTDLGSLSRRELRRMRHRIQMVFQDPRGSLDPRMNVSTLIGEPLRVHAIGDRASRARAVAEAMELVGLPAAVADRLPSELSGGQQQRVGIARAIVTDPAVLVCDEPVSALDVSIQAQIINVLDELRDELDLAMLFIAHDLSVVRHLSDRVAVMYLGQLVETGTASEVFSAPRHPYTQGLISSVPRADAESAARLQTARRLVLGELPSLLDPPSGCRYRTRCPYADDECAAREPPPEWVEASDGRHSLRCPPLAQHRRRVPTVRYQSGASPMSDRTAISTDGAPTPTGPFSQAIRVGNLVFTAGQAGRNRDTGQMGDIGEQADWALRNISNILAAAGASMADVVKTTVYLKEGTPTGPLNEQWVKHFPEPLPARSSVFVARLKNPEMLIEVEAVAIV